MDLFLFREVNVCRQWNENVIVCRKTLTSWTTLFGNSQVKCVCVTRTKSRIFRNENCLFLVANCVCVCFVCGWRKVFCTEHHPVVIAVLFTVYLICSGDRKYQKSVDQLQTAMDKMHKKGLTVEQYLSSVLSAVCIAFVHRRLGWHS